VRRISLFVASLIQLAGPVAVRAEARPIVSRDSTAADSAAAPAPAADTTRIVRTLEPILVRASRLDVLSSETTAGSAATSCARSRSTASLTRSPSSPAWSWMATSSTCAAPGPANCASR